METGARVHTNAHTRGRARFAIQCGLRPSAVVILCGEVCALHFIIQTASCGVGASPVLGLAELSHTQAHEKSRVVSILINLNGIDVFLLTERVYTYNVCVPK